MKKLYSVLCINSLTCVGRCGLATTIPVLSALGVRPCVLPTMVLATLPNIDKNSAKQSCANYLEPALDTLVKTGIDFDCIYSGFLESEKQLENTNKAFDLWEKAIKIVDPVMGDNGAIYSLITPSLVTQMCKLCSKADIITPNTTESAVLLGLDITEVLFTDQSLRARVEALQVFCNQPIVTGAKMADGNVVLAGMCKTNGYFTIKCNYTPVYYPGTGDLFTSVLTGLVTKSMDIKKACEKAVNIVEKAVKITHENGGESCLGLWTEGIMADLIQ